MISLFDIKQRIIVVLFYALCFSVVALSFTFKRIDDNYNLSKREKKSEGTSVFNESQIYLVKAGKNQLSLSSTKLSHNQAGDKFEFLTPVGDYYLNEKIIKYSSLRGTLNLTNGVAELFEEVKFNEGSSKLHSDWLSMNQKSGVVSASGRVDNYFEVPKTLDKVSVWADRAMLNFRDENLTYSGNAHGKILRARPYEESITFSSDKFFLNKKDNKANFTGNVKIQKGSIKAEGKEGEIFLENYNKKLKYYSLNDDVKVEQRMVLADGSEMIRKAFGEKLEGIIPEEKIVLSGYPKVFQGTDVIRGNSITIREHTEVVEVDDASAVFKLKDNR